MSWDSKPGRSCQKYWAFIGVRKSERRDVNVDAHYFDVRTIGKSRVRLAGMSGTVLDTRNASKVR